LPFLIRITFLESSWLKMRRSKFMAGVVVKKARRITKGIQGVMEGQGAGVDVPRVPPNWRRSSKVI
jgi:hypothetical protein